MDGKDPLNPNPIGNFPNRKRFADFLTFSSNHHAFKNLNPFFLSFNDFHVDANGIPNFKSRNRIRGKRLL